MVMCWAPDCKHYNVRNDCKFYRFPKSGNERRRWKRLLRRDLEPGPGAYVCSCHFRDGKKENGPELFLHNVSKRLAFPPTPEKKKRTKRKQKELGSPIATQVTESSITTLEEGPSTSGLSVKSLVTVEERVSPGPSTSTGTSVHTNPFNYNVVLEAENYFLKMENQELKKKLQNLSVRFRYANIQENDKYIILYTGLPNRVIFEALYNFIKDVEIVYYFGWNVKKLEKIDQLLLTLMKLRLNTPHLDLAERFGISESAVSNVFLTFVHLLYEMLYQQLMSNMPSRKKNKTCLPNCFSNFTNCRAVIDCTEIFTVVSRKSMNRQRITYSNYKHRNTFKGLIGVAPNGVITYASDLYVGSTSDKRIVKDCGILQLFETGDLILADKGFLIQDVLPVGVSLNIPPFLRTPQFTPDQVTATENIARARIHVERAIRRMKVYKILTLMSEAFCPFADVIFKCIAALTNLHYPLIKEVSELYISDNDCDDLEANE